MKISHGFGLRAHNLIGLFDKTNKVSTFMNKVEKQSLLDTIRYDSNSYKGDAFEFLVEILLKSHAYDNRLGITGYEPVQSDDNGVDGFGVNLTGQKCVVQVKYRSNKNNLLTANEDKLGNLISDGMLKHGVYLTPETTEDVKSKKIAPLHYVVTTANGLHHYTDNEFFKGVVHCIGYDQLRSMLDGNLSFWNLCREVAKKITEKVSS
jgi:hypothetical protein